MALNIGVKKQFGSGSAAGLFTAAASLIKSGGRFFLFALVVLKG
jgi:hypothetical protein